LPLVLEFSFSDILVGSLLIGVVPGEHIARETVVIIEQEFDDGVGLTVGDTVAQARLQAISDNTPQKTNYYGVDNSFQYQTDTNVRVFLATGAPTKGYATVIVYLD
jgi:hypothetical protein